MISASMVRLDYTHYPWRWAVSFSYDPTLVEEIKYHIDSTQRRWDAESRAWWFTANSIDRVLVLVDNYCTKREREIDSLRSHQDGSELSEEDVAAYLCLHVTPSAPDALILAAYRTLAKVYHPDVGGSTQDMQRLNQAYKHLMPNG